jgi:molecular chaperone DnaK
MRTLPPTVVIDFGPTSAAAVLVADALPGQAAFEPRSRAAPLRSADALPGQAAWLLPDPSTGQPRWPNGLQPATELFAMMRGQAQRHAHATNAGSVDRAVITIPGSLTPGDPRRGRLIGAAEAAGFAAVELVLDAAGALWAPGSPVTVGDVVLVYDLGSTFEAVIARVGDDLPEVLAHASIQDWPPDAQPGSPAALELTMACCRDLLGNLGMSRPTGPPAERSAAAASANVAPNVAAPALDWVLPVGGGARTPGLDQVLDRGLGPVPVAWLEEPELAVVRGTAHWLPRSGPRTVMARPAADRMTPLVFTFPGGSAQLLRWLVQPEESYDEGAPLARVRLAGGALWELTARTRGTLDQVLVDGEAPVSSGEWLALART